MDEHFILGEGSPTVAHGLQEYAWGYTFARAWEREEGCKARFHESSGKKQRSLLPSVSGSKVQSLGWVCLELWIRSWRFS